MKLQNHCLSAEPIGKNVRLYGKRFTVIGVLKKRRSWFIWG
jgi:hypothetical protein